MAVTTDVLSDMRVRKVCDFLLTKNARLEVVGRRMFNTFDTQLPFKVKLFNLLFKRGVLFYAEYNLRFFFYGLFKRFDVIVANDLDTLLPCYLLSKLKSVELVYDSHEYFTESVGLQNRPLVRGIWLKIERWILPKVKRTYTVSPSIAKAYFQKYNVDFKLVRNFPKSQLNFKKLAFDTDKKVILYQGVFNPGRNLHAVIESMKYIDDAIFVLIGYGELETQLKEKVTKLNLSQKVKFLGKLPYEDMMGYAASADLGIALEEPFGESFKYSLPNKIFDYTLVQLPFVTLATHEVKSILTQHKIGIEICFETPEQLAKIFRDTLSNSALLNEIKQNQHVASKHFAWENECKELEKVYEGLF
jgi:glycosyltransferase involved in cell wall biosynthesis